MILFLFMKPQPLTSPYLFNIALVGGGADCIALLRKQEQHRFIDEVPARIVAVADPHPDLSVVDSCQNMGMHIVAHHRKLYDPEFSVQLMVVLDENSGVISDLRETKPAHIQVISFEAFKLFCEAISFDKQRLKQRTEEIETVLNGIQDFILVITPGMDIVDVNEAFLKQMGFTRHEVIGRKCHEVHQRVHQQCNRHDIVCPLNQAIQKRRPNQQVLTRIDHEGQQRHIEVTIFPIWEKDGKLSKFIEISRDITERITQEEKTRRVLSEMVERRTKELEETHAKLLHQDKMASLGKLSASVVHEINNPIAGILNLNMLIQRLMAGESLQPKQKNKINRYLTLMETETRRISRIVSNLLAFSRQSKLELKGINLNRLIEKTLLLNSNLLSLSNVNVERHFDPDLPDLIGSEDQLQQVFMNIISNAVEAMESKNGGTLTIDTTLSLENNTVRVAFADTGIGISEENLTQLFEPFYTTKKKGKGVGLGLSVAYGIVQEHGGSISVTSTPGSGTTFRVSLPLKHAADIEVRPGGTDG